MSQKVLEQIRQGIYEFRQDYGIEPTLIEMNYDVAFKLMMELNMCYPVSDITKHPLSRRKIFGIELEVSIFHDIGTPPIKISGAETHILCISLEK